MRISATPRFFSSFITRNQNLAPSVGPYLHAVFNRGLSIDAGLISLTAVLGHCARDGVIEESVQRPKVVGADRRVQFDRELGDGLTDVAIVVHHLRYGESLTQEIVSVLDRAPADLRARPLAEAERVSQLIQEHGDTCTLDSLRSYCFGSAIDVRNGTCEERRPTGPGCSTGARGPFECVRVQNETVRAGSRR